MDDKAKQLAEEHAGYIEELLEAHDEPEDVRKMILFHYKSSFIHGYKHGQEDLRNEQRRTNELQNMMQGK